ncbi:unnamed protein product, partial [Laminaria digitata]
FYDEVCSSNKDRTGGCVVRGGSPSTPRTEDNLLRAVLPFPPTPPLGSVARRAEARPLLGSQFFSDLHPEFHHVPNVAAAAAAAVLSDAIVASYIFAHHQALQLRFLGTEQGEEADDLPAREVADTLAAITLKAVSGRLYGWVF